VAGNVLYVPNPVITFAQDLLQGGHVHAQSAILDDALVTHSKSVSRGVADGGGCICLHDVPQVTRDSLSSCVKR